MRVPHDSVPDDDEIPQFDRRHDHGLLAVLSLVPGALLVLGLGLHLGGRAPQLVLITLVAHVLMQFVVLLVYGAILTNDEGLERAGKALWAGVFLVAAPVALPLYYALRIHRVERPEGRVSVERVQTHLRALGGFEPPTHAGA